MGVTPITLEFVGFLISRPFAGEFAECADTATIAEREIGDLALLPRNIVGEPKLLAEL